MPLFYPPIDIEAVKASGAEINYAELAVLEALDKGLDDKWHVFHRLHWREVSPQGEKMGEADAVIFHPVYGILIVEIKGGGVRAKDGDWFQTNIRTGKEYKLDISPFVQARSSRFRLFDKLKRTSLGAGFEPNTAFTYTVWFPDITWTDAIPADAPNGAFILDSKHLNNPSQHIRNILKQSNPHAKPWSRAGHEHPPADLRSRGEPARPPRRKPRQDPDPHLCHDRRPAPGVQGPSAAETAAQ